MTPAPPLRLLAIASAVQDTPGGALRILDRVCQGLAARGAAVEVLSSRSAVSDAPDAATALARMRASMSERGRAISARIAAFRPTVVHCEFADETGHVAASLARAARIPFTATFHRLHVFADAAAQGGLLKALLDFHRQAARTVSYSRPQQAWLVGQAVRNSVVIGNGVDARRFTPTLRSASLRATWGAAAHDPVLLWVGRLLAQKNLGLLVQACDAARAACPGLRAVVIGDGPDRAALRARLPWAVFPGALEGPELQAAYASADLFAFPSRSSGIDNWANVVGEAMASALPVVAFGFGAADAWIANAHNGAVLAESDNAEADGVEFCRAVIALTSDQARRRALGAAARATVLDQGWDRTIDGYGRLFAECSAARPP